MYKHVTRYAVVGILGTSLHFLLLFIFVEKFSQDPVLSSIAAFPAVVILSYVLNKNWTFESDKAHAIALPKYLTVCFVSLMNNFLLMYLLVNVLEIWYMAAQAFSIAVIPVINFILKKYWAFA
tara:strand:- start:13929 stop:14297 length:369 start_codon:yes stop_codon:yes gene_type:complete